MRYLALGEVVDLHRRLLEATGAPPASAILAHLSPRSPNPRQPSRASICIRRWLRKPRRWVSRWSRATQTFLILNGSEIDAPVNDQERLILDLAAGRIGRSHLVDWLRQHVKPLA